MNKVKKGDYLIVSEERRKHLMRALEDGTGTTVEAVNEKNCHIKTLRLAATLNAKDVILNLGPTPAAGKVYGLDVTTLFYTKKTHDALGTVNFFYKPNPEVVKDLWAAFAKVVKILDKRGLLFILEGLCWEIQPYNGEKYAGRYMKSKKAGSKIPSRIQIRPEIMPATEYVYVILHELAHHIHFTYVTSKKLNALWLRLFNTSIKAVTVKREISQHLLEDLLTQEDAPSSFKRTLSEDDALAFKWIIRTIGQVSALSIKELDILFEADMKDDIRNIWPVRNIAHKELAPVISEYATKNHRECFAEAVSFMMVGKKLPEAIVKLIEKTLSHAKINEHQADEASADE